MAFSFVSLSYSYTILQTSIEEIFEEAINSASENPTSEEVAEFNNSINAAFETFNNSSEIGTLNSGDTETLSETLSEEKIKAELVQEVAASVVQAEMLKSDKTENTKTDILSAELLKQAVLAKSTPQSAAKTAIANSVAKSQKIIEYLEERTATVNFLKYNYDFSYQPGRLQLGNSRAILDKKDRNISESKNIKSLGRDEQIAKQKEEEKRLKESENRKERENFTLLNEMNRRVRVAEENRQKLLAAEKNSRSI